MKREHCLVLYLAVTAAIPARAGERAAPSYGDDDLARLHARRDETGVLSVSATKPELAPTRPRTPDPHAESYWRHEAEKLAEKLRPLRKEADTLRSRIANASRPTAPVERGSVRSKRPTRGSRSPSMLLVEPPARDTRLLEDQLKNVEREIQERQLELEERARRESALPGWIR